MPEFDRRTPFTTSQGLAAGLTRSTLSGRHFRRLLRGVYVDARVPDHPLIRVQAALLVHPVSAFASHLSAARLWDLPVPGSTREHISVFNAADRRPHPALVTHVAPASARVGERRRLRVADPVDTFVQLAELVGLVDLVDLVVAGDALVRAGHAQPQRLLAAAENSAWRGRGLAVRAARLVRTGVDSPTESRLRLLLVLARLPEPEVDVQVFSEGGRLRYRFDLAYRQLKVAVEYDGRQHRADLDQWDHDLERRDWMDAEGWTLVPVVARGVFQRPDETLERVLAALRRAGCSDLPRQLSGEWRRHFPVRGYAA